MIEGDPDAVSHTDPLPPAERARSDFVRDMVQGRDSPKGLTAWPGSTPRRLVQFWDDLRHLPDDVKACMQTWEALESEGFEVEVFDKDTAGEFIRNRLGPRYVNAFNKCYHPSMMSDYFRYAYVFAEGGFYVDADDVYHGKAMCHLFEDGSLKLQPFCYDIPTGQMVPPSDFTRRGADQAGWIFYFNTTPLIASRRHPIIGRALLNATGSLEADDADGLPEVQAATGPGNGGVEAALRRS